MSGGPAELSIHLTGARVDLCLLARPEVVIATFLEEAMATEPDIYEMWVALGTRFPANMKPRQRDCGLCVFCIWFSSRVARWSGVCYKDNARKPRMPTFKRQNM